MKVYIAWYDNGEPYEDGFVSLTSVFATEELALECINVAGYTVKKGKYYYLPKIKKPTACGYGVKYEDFAECEKCNECDRPCEFTAYYVLDYDNSFMYVEEREVLNEL